MTRLVARELEVTLPPVLAEIAEVAGIDVALLIARERGGTRVLVPSRASGDNWLTALVDADVASAIIDKLGPARRIDVPLGPASSMQQRSVRFAQLQAQGATEAQIARALGLTGRAVRYRRATMKRRAASKEPDLFD